ncbi:hypothetical protein GQ457_15G017020 [Hibiscus cannabinus]
MDANNEAESTRADAKKEMSITTKNTTEAKKIMVELVVLQAVVSQLHFTKNKVEKITLQEDQQLAKFEDLPNECEHKIVCAIQGILGPIDTSGSRNTGMLRHIGMKLNENVVASSRGTEKKKLEKIFSPHNQLALPTGTTGHVYPPPGPVYLHLRPAAKTTGRVLLPLSVAPAANRIMLRYKVSVRVKVHKVSDHVKVSSHHVLKYTSSGNTATSMERGKETGRTKPIAVFMAFGTKGDVYPIAAIAAAFATDQNGYDVAFITHSAHENLSSHFAKRDVIYVPISSPPVLSTNGTDDKTEFSEQKNIITKEHRRECYSAVERLLGDDPCLEGDFIGINFFALEGWSLAELFYVHCVVLAPYVVPYCAPSYFEHHFRKEFPLLYKYFQEAPADKVCWKDVIHWMWPLFSENWESWRSEDLNLSPYPFTDPVTGLPTWHDRPPSPLLLYGFSKEIVECPDYWPSNTRVCGFWFLPTEWQFSCPECGEISTLLSSGHLTTDDLCSAHAELQYFIKNPLLGPPIFIGLSSIGSMGFMRNPRAFLEVVRTVLEVTCHRFILFTAGYEPLDAAVQEIAYEASSVSNQRWSIQKGLSIFDSRLFCFSG